MLLTSPAYAEAHGLAPLARVRSAATAGVPPRIMGIGPVPAAAKALERAGLAMDDMGLVEVNEAFAAQVLAVLREWDMDPEDPRLNVERRRDRARPPARCLRRPDRRRRPCTRCAAAATCSSRS